MCGKVKVVFGWKHISPQSLATIRRIGAIMVGVFIFALVPRALMVGNFVTIDEAYHWFGRADRFFGAIRSAQFAQTNIVGHPGVTTMWLGAGGVWLHRTLAEAGWVSINDANIHRALLRQPVAITTASGIALSYPLLRRLFTTPVALLAVLFWAGDPFVIAHSQLLHTDALLTTWITVALLSALVAFGIGTTDARSDQVVRWPALVGSGVAAGLALLTKSPSIIVPLLVGGIALIQQWRHRRSVYRIVGPLGVWSMVALATWFVGWPAAWVDPIGAITTMAQQAQNDGGSPHGWGNFFWGQTVADPGWLFYPVALALRITPWTTIGLGLALAAAVWQRQHLANRCALLWLIIAAIAFVGMMSALPKKFDRYVLPVFPLLDTLAAAGWIALLVRVQRDRSRWFKVRGYTLHAAAAALIALTLWWYHPYELAFYNPLLGGGSVASTLLPIGWGEGLEQAGTFIATHYEGCDRPIATWFGPALQPYVCDQVVPLDWSLQPGKARYAVLYIDQIQRNNVPQATTQLRATSEPLYTVKIHGIEYAYVYPVVPPVAHRVDAQFGDNLHVQGYSLDTSAFESGVITATVQWHSSQPPAQQSMFFHVIDHHGTVIGRADMPLVGTHAPATDWQAQQIVTWDQPIPIAPDLLPGTYWLALGVYNTSDGARLALDAAPPPANAPSDGADALLEPLPLP